MISVKVDCFKRFKRSRDFESKVIIKVRLLCFESFSVQLDNLNSMLAFYREEYGSHAIAFRAKEAEINDF
jgi:hypothetical protein